MPILQPNGDAEVSISEKGQLKLDKQTGIPIVGTLTLTHEVPTGKKWIIKGVSTGGSGSFTFTSGSIVIDLASTGNDYVLERTTSFAVEFPCGSHQITLSEGDKIEVNFVCSAYTSGSVQSQLLYQEYDA